MLMRDEHCGNEQEALALLREQHALYGALESFAARQRRLVTSDDPDLLLALLVQRQKAASRLTDIARALAPIRDDWTSYRNRLVPRQREEAEQLLAESRGRLQKVIESDEQDARLLQVRKMKTLQSLERVRTTGEAINAYRTAASGPGSLNHRMDEDA